MLGTEKKIHSKLSTAIYFHLKGSLTLIFILSEKSDGKRNFIHKNG